MPMRTLRGPVEDAGQPEDDGRQPERHPVGWRMAKVFDMASTTTKYSNVNPTETRVMARLCSK